MIDWLINDRIPGLWLTCSSTDVESQPTVCNNPGAVCDLTKRPCRSGRRACAPALSTEAWPKRGAPRAERNKITPRYAAHRRAAAGISTHFLIQEEGVNTAVPLQAAVRDGTREIQGQQNDIWKCDLLSAGVSLRWSIHFPYIILACFVRRQCPAPTPERAHILMAVGSWESQNYARIFTVNEASGSSTSGTFRKSFYKVPTQLG